MPEIRNLFIAVATRLRKLLRNSPTCESNYVFPLFGDGRFAPREVFQPAVSELSNEIAIHSHDIPVAESRGLGATRLGRTLMRLPANCIAIMVISACTMTAHGVASDTTPVHGVQTLLEGSVHLRNGESPEWDEFADSPGQASWTTQFDSAASEQATTLRLRQYDVKARWTVTINDKVIGDLIRDENPMWTHFAIPAGTLKPAKNLLRIDASAPKNSTSDDVRVGSMQLMPIDKAEWLGSSELNVSVADQSGRAVPARITILDESGALVETGAASSLHTAVRPGIVYTLSGTAAIPVPPGELQVYAGRGFEYTLARRSVSLEHGGKQSIQLTIQRQVDTSGWVACDTHVHTRTHSGHGDCTVGERMVTLAGEGIELPIATDHNVNIDHRPFAIESGANKYFTPIIGNEVTTRWGHFNVFPIEKGAPAPDHRGENWDAIFGAIEQCPEVKAIILNHARDVHSNFRPFGAVNFNDVVGENLQGWRLRANAMEILNSSATQTDIMRLPRDWMALLNAGLRVTPVGCSDSHDVARHFVGQGRTYIRCDDSDPSKLDIEMATANFVAGRVRVSYGLLVELFANQRWTAGELASAAGMKEIPIQVRVRAPHWIGCDRVTIFANGTAVHTVRVDSSKRVQDILWEGQWQMPRPDKDVWLTAIATGPGIEAPYWRTAKPYQSDGPKWNAQVMGCSGAVRLDADGDGRFQSARDYAIQVLADVGNQPSTEMVQKLSEYDAATTSQTLHLLNQSGGNPLSNQIRQSFDRGSSQVQKGYSDYLNAWRASRESIVRPN